MCNFSKEDGLIPINKNLFSLSFAFITGSSAFLIFIILFLIIEHWRLWSGSPFAEIGKHWVYYCNNIKHPKLFIFTRPKFNYSIPWTQYILQYTSMEMATSEWNFSHGIFNYGLLGNNILVCNSISHAQEKYIYCSVIHFSIYINS